MRVRKLLPNLQSQTKITFVCGMIQRRITSLERSNINVPFAIEFTFNGNGINVW